MSYDWDSTSSSARSSISTNSSISTQHLELKPDTEHKLFDLLEATNKFSEENIIAKGELSKTYKGLLNNGETVAVKRYNLKKDYFNTFKNELEQLTKNELPKLVALKGYCKEDKEFIIVHEFMKLGSLADHLFGGEHVEEMLPIPWEKRLMICTDVAETLSYLHDQLGMSRKLIHGYVNPTNILLAEGFKPKLSEFGFSREAIANAKTVGVITCTKGPTKYIDPHHQMTGKLTRKSDIYSFGVVLLDVLLGKNFPNLDETENPNGQQQDNLHEWTKRCLKDKTLDQFVDERLKGQISKKCLTDFAELASRCLHNDNPQKRPEMSEVSQTLERILKRTQKTPT